MFADNYKWYKEDPVADEWVHIAVIWKPTDSLSYLNGQKMFKYVRNNIKIPVVLNSEMQLSSASNPGEFSAGNVDLWSNMKSPGFIWKLYQEGLSNA